MLKKQKKSQPKTVIAQVLPALKQGGVERGTIEIAAALQKEQIENYVISSGGAMVKELEQIGVEHITLPMQTKNPFQIWKNAKLLEAVLKKKKITLVHVRSRAPAWSVKLACQRLKIPFIATFHGLYGLSPRLFKKPYNRVMTQGEVVIAVSRFVEKHVIENYGISPQKVRCIPRGADMDQFNRENISKTALNQLIKQHNIPQNKPIIVLVGRLSRIKGHFLLLNAIRQMKNQNFTLLFIGGNPKGDYEVKLQEALRQLPPSVDFRMFALSSHQMPLGYALADICVQPTLVPETFGRSMVEAQATGCVVVASAHGGALELIDEGKTGFLFEPGDVNALAARLDEVLNLTPRERKQIGEKAQKSARSNYSIQKMCDKTIAVYREVLGIKS